MKKIVISGSSKLVDKVKYWVDYFEEKGYHVLDYPKYTGEVESAEKHENHMTNIYNNYYRNLEETNVFFLMNEMKDGVEGYIGPSAISELTYVVIQNLIHAKNIQIYILKEPSKELACYDEVRFFLNKGWIKFWNNEIK